MRKNLKKWAQKTLLATGATAVALLAAEAAIRIIWTDPQQGKLDRIQHSRESVRTALQRSSDSDRVYELKPNARGFAWGTFVEINSLGFRGAETTRAKEHQYRIATVGDSIAFGNGMPPGTAFPYRLQERLAGTCRPVEILNFAVGGYDAIQVVATVDDQVAQFNPDLVLWAFCLNDITTHSNNLDHFERSISFANSVFFRSHLIRYLFRGITRSELAAQSAARNDPAVFSRIHAGQIDPIGDDEIQLREWMAKAEALSWPGHYFHRETHVGRLRYAFRRLQDIATRTGFDVAILVVPQLETTNGRYLQAPVHQIVESEAERHSWSVIDVLGSFSRYGLNEVRLRNRPNDRLHPSPFGHDLIAAAIHGHLDARGPLSCIDTASK